MPFLIHFFRVLRSSRKKIDFIFAQYSLSVYPLYKTYMGKPAVILINFLQHIGFPWFAYLLYIAPLRSAGLFRLFAAAEDPAENKPGQRAAVKQRKTSANFRLAGLPAATTIDCSGLYHTVLPLVSVGRHFLTFFQKSSTSDRKLWTDHRAAFPRRKHGRRRCSAQFFPAA